MKRTWTADDTWLRAALKDASEPAALLGHPHRLPPVPRVQLLHHGGQVVAHCAWGQVQRLGQLGHGGMVAAGGQHLVLARGQWRLARTAPPRPVRHLDALAAQRAADRRVRFQWFCIVTKREKASRSDV